MTGKLHYGLQVQKQEFRIFNGYVNNNYGMLFVTCQSMDTLFPVGGKITRLDTVVQNEKFFTRIFSYTGSTELSNLLQTSTYCCYFA